MPIRSLVITKLPFPPVGGEHLRSWQNINSLSKLGPVHVFSVFRHDYDTTNIDTVETWHSYNVNDHPSLWHRLESIIWWFAKRGLWDYWPYRYSAAKRLEALLAELNPDLVVIEELWLYPYLSSAQRYPVIFDHHNVEAPLFESTKCQGNGLRGWLRAKFHLPQIKADERQFMCRAIQTWVCSDTDKQQLLELYRAPGKRYVVPNAINLDNYEAIRSGQGIAPLELEKRARYLLYLGNFGYVPNAEAADLLINQIYPRLRKNYPDCHLLLVGREPTTLMLAAAQKNRTITVTGQVTDVRPYLATGAVMVVPLQRGSGTRFKILEAFAAHCPVVSTKKGAEGLSVEDGQQILIRQSSEAIAQGIEHLWNNPKYRQEMTRAAYELVRKAYSWEASAQAVRRSLSRLFPMLSKEINQTEITNTAETEIPTIR